jgi:hypothetical protein
LPDVRRREVATVEDAFHANSRGLHQRSFLVFLSLTDPEVARMLG